MNQTIARIEEIGAFGSNDSQAVPWAGKFIRLQASTNENVQQWMQVHALVYRKVNGVVLAAVAKKAMPLHLNDVIQTGGSCVLAVEFVLGGEVGVNANSTVRVVSERSLASAQSGFLAILQRQAGIWDAISHEKSQHLLIQTNGGVTSIKG